MTKASDRPRASTSDARRRLASQAQRDTGPERSIRRELFRRGLRYRTHRRPERLIRRTADIVFPAARVAVFIHGCWWHGCPDHATLPKVNTDWWRAKLHANRDRDADTRSRLSDLGWRVIEVWEHESPPDAAQRIEKAVVARRNLRSDLRCQSRKVVTDNLEPALPAQG
jgi:DNA mismatch endonuclease (patch repair protein)